jgi:hypothetical protein
VLVIERHGCTAGVNGQRPAADVSGCRRCRAWQSDRVVAASPKPAARSCNRLKPIKRTCPSLIGNAIKCHFNCLFAFLVILIGIGSDYDCLFHLLFILLLSELQIAEIARLNLDAAQTAPEFWWWWAELVSISPLQAFNA